jgi:hypothetical protein
MNQPEQKSATPGSNSKGMESERLKFECRHPWFALLSLPRISAAEMPFAEMPFVAA